MTDPTDPGGHPNRRAVATTYTGTAEEKCNWFPGRRATRDAGCPPDLQTERRAESSDGGGGKATQTGKS